VGSEPILNGWIMLEGGGYPAMRERSYRALLARLDVEPGGQALDWLGSSMEAN